MKVVTMEEKLESSSFLSLLGADSGLTLINTDALVRKTELQQRKLQCKDKEIEELKERLEHLEDVVEKCKLYTKTDFITWKTHC